MGRLLQFACWRVERENHLWATPRVIRAVLLENMKAGLLGDTQHVFLRRRDSLWLTQCLRVLVTFALSCEVHSGLLRTDSPKFEKDELVIEKSDVYAMAGSALQYFETDHYVLAVHNAWDLGRRIRAIATLIHSSPSQPHQVSDRDQAERRCTTRAT